MERIVLIFRNAFRAILHARSLYLWIIAILVVGVQLAPQIIFRDKLPDFVAMGRQRPLPPGLSEQQQKEMQEAIKKQQEIQMQQIREQFRNRRPQALAGGLSTWTFFVILFGILLGSNVLASEVSAKTIITVLARPISRWELLLGKWLAIQVFGILSLLLGVAIHFAAGLYLDIHFSSLIWLALVHAMVAIMLYSALAMLLGTIMGPMVAAGIAALVDLFPTAFITFMNDSETTWVHWIGVGLKWLIPPGFQNMFVNSVDATRVIDRTLLSHNLMMNLLFLAIFFATACVVFTRREVRLG